MATIRERKERNETEKSSWKITRKSKFEDLVWKNVVLFFKTLSIRITKTDFQTFGNGKSIWSLNIL